MTDDVVRCCTHCGKVKSLAEFGPGRADCKACAAARTRKWQARVRSGASIRRQRRPLRRLRAALEAAATERW